MAITMMKMTMMIMPLFGINKAMVAKVTITLYTEMFKSSSTDAS